MLEEQPGLQPEGAPDHRAERGVDDLRADLVDHSDEVIAGALGEAPPMQAQLTGPIGQVEAMHPDPRDPHPDLATGGLRLGTTSRTSASGPPKR